MPPGRSGVSRRAGTLATAATLALAATVLLTACACGSDDDEATDTSSSTTPTTEAPPATVSVEDEVETAYLAFWEMFVRLAEAPDPTDPEITDRASGEALGNLVDGLTTLQSSNQRSDFGRRYRHDVLMVDLTDDSTAVLEDCAVDDSRVVDVSTGRTVAEGLVTEHLQATLILSGNQWRVDRTSRLNSWNGEVSCVQG